MTKFNSTYRNLDLLSFISINDPLLTQGIPCKCWIDERTVSWKRKRLEFGVQFDIHPNDPLIVRIGKIVKGNFPDVIINGNFSDKIANGKGVK